MGILYHGSNIKGLKRIEPHQSTHGNYVYATKLKELAYIFSGKAGDDCTYTLFRNSDSEPWQLVERVPEAFNVMYSGSAAIYTVSDTTFKDINTGFSELVSQTGVNINSEEDVNNIYDKIKELASDGKINLYLYPNKPKEIPFDNSDLIERQIKQSELRGRKISKNDFNRILLFHPYLLDKINKKMSFLKIDEPPFNEDDIIELFEKTVITQAVFPKREQFLKSIVSSVNNTYPKLTNKLLDVLTYFDLPKKKQVTHLINKLSINNDTEFIDYLKKTYENDQRSFSAIGQDILQEATRKIEDTKNKQDDLNNQPKHKR